MGGAIGFHHLFPSAEKVVLLIAMTGLLAAETPEGWTQISNKTFPDLGNDTATLDGVTSVTDCFHAASHVHFESFIYVPADARCTFHDQVEPSHLINATGTSLYIRSEYMAETETSVHDNDDSTGNNATSTADSNDVIVTTEPAVTTRMRINSVTEETSTSTPSVTTGTSVTTATEATSASSIPPSDTTTTGSKFRSTTSSLPPDTTSTVSIKSKAVTSAANIPLAATEPSNTTSSATSPVTPGSLNDVKSAPSYTISRKAFAASSSMRRIIAVTASNTSSSLPGGQNSSLPGNQNASVPGHQGSSVPGSQGSSVPASQSGGGAFCARGGGSLLLHILIPAVILKVV